MTICLVKLFFIHLNFFGSSFSCNGFSLCVLMYIILSHTLHLITISLIPKRLSCVVNGNHLLTLYIISLLNSNCKRILMRFCYNYFLLKSNLIINYNLWLLLPTLHCTQSRCKTVWVINSPDLVFAFNIKSADYDNFRLGIATVRFIFYFCCG